MDNWLMYLIILVAIGIGWWLGRRDAGSSAQKVEPGFSRDYYRGLNYLLNEQPDQAISTFIDSLEINNQTIETHLALGGLLRKRGELDKAVTVHQNLLSGAKLNRELAQEVQLELARDYLLAGLLDRAEKLLQLIIAEGGKVRVSGLKMLVEIYQQEHEWEHAIEAVAELKGIDSGDYQTMLAHLYCEQAEVSRQAKDFKATREYLRRALLSDPRCVRASLTLGAIMHDEGDHAGAINVLETIRIQDARLVPESCNLLEKCYAASQLPRGGYREYLTQCLETEPAITIVLALAKSIREEQGDEAMAHFISDHLKKNPSLKGLTSLIDLHIDNTSGIARENLAILRSFTEALVADKPSYRCRECGFSGKKMHWMCPGCKEWGTVSPIFGLEGE